MATIFGHPTSSRALSKALIALSLIIIIAVVSAGAYVLIVTYPQNPGSTPSPTPNPSPTPINSPTPTPTIKPTTPPTVTPAPNSSATTAPIQPTPTPTLSVSPTPSPSPQPTASPTPTPSPTGTPTPTPTSSPAPTSGPTPTATPIPTPTPAPAAPKYSLSEAVSAGYVEANITGYPGGASSGDSIVVNIRRLTSYPIEIDPLPTGTLLVTSSSAQNMAVLKLEGLKSGLGYYPRDTILLDTTNPTQWLFSGYCVNFHRSNPSSSTLFTQSGLADANVIKIFNVLDQLPSSVTTLGAIQTAVSVVTDDVSHSELQSTWPSFVSEIQNARTILEKAGIDISKAQLFL
ncbi:MAG: hypothetical protein M1167_01935 [Chloroflexi bacterium]|nr:hypothetical protein [Chloroflexota bacterium]